MNGQPMHWRQERTGQLASIVGEVFFHEGDELEGPEILSLKDYLLGWLSIADQLPRGMHERIANCISNLDFQLVAMDLRRYGVDPIFEAFICQPCKEGWHHHQQGVCRTLACSCLGRAPRVEAVQRDPMEVPSLA